MGVISDVKEVVCERLFVYGNMFAKVEVWRIMVLGY